MAHLYTRCLMASRFLPEWKRAKLVLIPKEGKPGDLPSSYRPICLLDEAGKILKRIIADRIVQHLSRIGPDLSREQYGFRSGRSTIDAIIRVRSTSEAAAEEGGVLMAVSLDISNAFNILPPPPTFIHAGEARVRVGESMRYLGLHLGTRPGHLASTSVDWPRE